MGQEDPTDEDCANVRFVCEVISRRAAHISAAGVATLLNKMGKEHVTVAVDGSVYRFHPHFHDLMVDKINELINPGLSVSMAENPHELRKEDVDYVRLKLQFDLMLSEDGSGRGAALVAAVACRISNASS